LGFGSANPNRIVRRIVNDVVDAVGDKTATAELSALALALAATDTAAAEATACADTTAAAYTTKTALTSVLTWKGDAVTGLKVSANATPFMRGRSTPVVSRMAFKRAGSDIC
jgi:hypothetical protein